MLEELENDLSANNDHYPTTLTDAYRMVSLGKDHHSIQRRNIYSNQTDTSQSVALIANKEQPPRKFKIGKCYKWKVQGLDERKDIVVRSNLKTVHQEYHFQLRWHSPNYYH